MYNIYIATSNVGVHMYTVYIVFNLFLFLLYKCILLPCTSAEFPVSIVPVILAPYCVGRFFSVVSVNPSSGINKALCHFVLYFF